MLATMLSFLMLSTALSAAPKDFWGFWGDGKAELSSYKMTISRYGELREGYAVLIFVTEDISRKTRIKVESNKIPKEDRVPVLKLNHVMKFNTGIYDYSVMTSVFSSVESELGRPPLEPLKISFSSQEWCGHVYQMLIPQQNEVDFTIHSYFEREGDEQRKIRLPKNAVYEDNLLIWIRELKGEVMKSGEKRQVQMIPSMWYTRSRNAKVAFAPAQIAKEDGGELSLNGESLATWRWTWTIGKRTQTYWVEKQYPHRILKWQFSDGGKGELVKSLRLPYWKLNSNGDLHYRQELGIPQ